MKFVYFEHVNKALEIAFNTERNIVLFGKGGHAKSEGVIEFFKSKKITPFVKTLGSGTTVDSLNGGLDIKEFNKSGKLEYLVENSFMNHEYVVFEELLDAPDYILESLKDTLTAKCFRNGTQVFSIKTKLIVCCTNKTREEFAKNDSLKALMERFPLSVEVKWPEYTEVAYSKLFRESLGKDNPELAYILGNLAKAGTIVSPRTAVIAYDMVDKMGIDTLQVIADFSGKNQGAVKDSIQKFKAVKEFSDLKLLIEDKSGVLVELEPKTLEDIKKAKSLVKSLEKDIVKIKTLKADDDLLNSRNKLISNVGTAINQMNAKIEALTRIEEELEEELKEKANQQAKIQETLNNTKKVKVGEMEVEVVIDENGNARTINTVVQEGNPEDTNSF